MNKNESNLYNQDSNMYSKSQDLYGLGKDSDLYKTVLLRDLIKQQIQNLISQLAENGVESILLTATMTDVYTSSEGDAVVVGSELGQMFLYNYPDINTQFQDYCSNCIDYRSNTFDPTDQPAPVRNGKRSASEMNGQNAHSCEASNPSLDESSPKRSRSLSLPIKTEHQSDEDSMNQLNLFVSNSSMVEESESTAVSYPSDFKGMIKCCVCSYQSKFRANVTRHERSKHGFHGNVALSPAVHYACSMCRYKSPYRSNLIRHEKTVHKVFSSSLELDHRKIQEVQPTEQTSDIKPSHLYPDWENTSSEHSSSYEQLSMQAEDSSRHPNKILDSKSNSRLDEISDPNSQPCDRLDKLPSSEQKTKCAEYLNKSNINHDTKSNITHDAKSNITHDTKSNITHDAKFNITHDAKSNITHDAKFNITHDAKSNITHDAKSNITHDAITKQEVCDCGKTFQYRTSLLKHKEKCEHLITSPKVVKITYL